MRKTLAFLPAVLIAGVLACVAGFHFWPDRAQPGRGAPSVGAKGAEPSASPASAGKVPARSSKAGAEVARKLMDPDTGPAERLRLIRKAGRMKLPEAITPLLAALEDLNAIIRGEAAEALGKIGGERALAPLVKCLEDVNPTVRQSAARGLGQLGRKDAVAALLAGLKANRNRPDGYGQQIRTEIVRALRGIGDRRSVGPLIAELGLREDLSYKNEVVAALGGLGDPRAIGPIKEHLAALEQRKPTEKIALFPWQEAVKAARDSLRKLEHGSKKEG